MNYCKLFFVLLVALIYSNSAVSGRTYINGFDPSNYHWTGIGGGTEPNNLIQFVLSDNGTNAVATGFRVPVIFSGGIDMAYGRTYISGFDGSHNHWWSIKDAPEPGSVFIGFKTDDTGQLADSIFLSPQGRTALVAQPGKVGIGTDTSIPCSDCTLSVGGKIQAESIVVSTTWADYVFKKDYQLMELDNLSAFIDKNGHLPGIPKEAEVAEQGIDLGAMQTTLLAKIEELTLYMIELKNENKALKKEIMSIKESANLNLNMK